MPTFESYIQNTTGTALPPGMVTAPQVDLTQSVVIDAPIVVDSTNWTDLKPFNRFIAGLECNSNVVVAAAEGKRLAPYFNMMSQYLSGEIDNSARLASEEQKDEIRKLTTPAGLASLFNAAAKKSKNTLTTDVAVLPSNITTEGPASHLFRNERQFDVPYFYRNRTFNFGFLQVFEGGKQQAKSSTTFPTFLLDKDMINAARPYGVTGILKDFQSIMTMVNHDMLHHYTSPLVNHAIAFKFKGAPDSADTPIGGWNDKLKATNVEPRSFGDYYEAWSKVAHSQPLTSSAAAEQVEAARDSITRYFDALKNVASGIQRDGANAEEAKQRAHEVVDYFGTVMCHALSRAYPLNHPLMQHCVDRLEAADPAPGILLQECAGMISSTRNFGAPKDFVILDSYRGLGLDILPGQDETLSYASLKMLQLIKLSPEDIESQIPVATSPQIANLRRVSGDITLEMLEAAARTFDSSLAPDLKPAAPVSPEETAPLDVRLASLARGNFNRVSKTDGKTLFAVSNVDADFDEMPDGFGLSTVEEVIALLAQPGFTGKNIDDLVTDTARRRLSEVALENPEYVKSFEMLTNRSQLGISLHMVAAAGTAGKTEMLCVLEDSYENKCLVIGDDTLSARASERLKGGNLTYVAKTSERAADKIEEFLLEAKRSAAPGRHMASLSESLIKAFGATCEIPAQFIRNGRVPGRTRPGDIMAAASRSMPTIYTSIIKPRHG
jgi:hypothetical protein